MVQIDVERLQQLVEEKYLTCRPHPTADVVIWNYSPRCQFEHYWIPETMMCRGLITKTDGTIVARGFQKFFNIEEHQETGLPLELFKVTEKMDGSLGILYHLDGKPYIATRGSFESEQAIKATQILQERYGGFDFLPYYSYLFEIVYPQNRIVVDYGDMEDLILLAVLRTDTGEEKDIHAPIWVNMWPFPVVKHYDGITDIATLRDLEEANKEGFVIRFESGLRVKAKYKDYVRLHRLITQVNAKTIWELLRANQSFDEMLDRVPDEYYKWVKSTRDSLIEKYQHIEYQSHVVWHEVRNLPTRKEQAAIVTKTDCAAVVFRMLDGKDYAEIIWKQLRPEAERPFREDIDA
jgi:RNA ligase